MYLTYLTISSFLIIYIRAIPFPYESNFQTAASSIMDTTNSLISEPIISLSASYNKKHSFVPLDKNYHQATTIDRNIYSGYPNFGSIFPILTEGYANPSFYGGSDAFSPFQTDNTPVNPSISPIILNIPNSPPFSGMPVAGLGNNNYNYNPEIQDDTLQDSLSSELFNPLKQNLSSNFASLRENTKTNPKTVYDSTNVATSTYTFTPERTAKEDYTNYTAPFLPYLAPYWRQNFNSRTSPNEPYYSQHPIDNKTDKPSTDKNIPSRPFLFNLINNSFIHRLISFYTDVYPVISRVFSEVIHLISLLTNITSEETLHSAPDVIRSKDSNIPSIAPVSNQKVVA